MVKTRADAARVEQNNDPAKENDDQSGDNNSGSETETDDTKIAGTYNGKDVIIPTNRRNFVAKLRQFVEYGEKARVRILELEEDNEHLLEVNDQLSKENAKFGKNDAEVAKIKAAVDKLLFPFVKFITDKDQQTKHARAVYKFVLAAKDGAEKVKFNEADFTVWNNTYGDVLTVLLNTMRGYSQERMRVAAMKFAKLHGYFPKVEEIWNCALRTVDMTNQRAKDIFEFYSTDLFCKSTFFLVQSAHNFVVTNHFACLTPNEFPGKAISNKQWKKELWYKGTPMSAINTNYDGMGNKKDVQLFTPSMEAFLITAYDNCRDRWVARAEYYKKENDWNAKLPDKKVEKDADGNRVKDPLHDGKYSSSDSGNCPFGSWTDVGINTFKTYLTSIQTRRNDPATRKLMVKFEETFLKYLQDKHLAGNNKKGKKRKAGEEAAPKKKKVTSGEELDMDIFG